MSCPDCEIDYAKVAKLAYGPVPKDGPLMTGEQIQRFALKVIEVTLKTPTLRADAEKGIQTWDAMP